MTRVKRSKKAREAIAARHNWTCHISGQTIRNGVDEWEIDHVIPLGGGGTEDEDNLRPVLKCHHKVKSVADNKRIKKGNRVRAKHLGTYRKSRRKIASRKKIASRPVPGSRSSGWKKPMNGPAILRTEEKT